MKVDVPAISAISSAAGDVAADRARHVVEDPLQALRPIGRQPPSPGGASPARRSA